MTGWGCTSHERMAMKAFGCMCTGREEARARAESPDTVRLPGGGDIYGADDSFAAAKARCVAWHRSRSLSNSLRC